MCARTCSWGVAKGTVAPVPRAGTRLGKWKRSAWRAAGCLGLLGALTALAVGLSFPVWIRQIGGASVLNGHITIADGVAITGMGMVMRSIEEKGIRHASLRSRVDSSNKSYVRISIARK